MTKSWGYQRQEKKNTCIGIFFVTLESLRPQAFFRDIGDTETSRLFLATLETLRPQASFRAIGDTETLSLLVVPFAMFVWGSQDRILIRVELGRWCVGA